MLVCSVCGFQTEKQGSYNLHKYHCNLRNGIQQQSKQETKKSKQECEHEFRLLNPRNEVERNALNQGYKEVCEKCQGVQ